MIEPVIHTTENRNIYIYDNRSGLSLLVHPELINAYSNSKKANSYYFNKSNYLKNKGLFKNLESANFGNINESMVTNSIIETTELIFEVTDWCNMSCAYCGYGDLYEGFDARNRKKMDIRNAKKLIKYVYRIKNNSTNRKLYISFYGGEPLTNINFIKQIVNFINKLNYDKKMDIDYYMTTNATLIHKHIDYLICNNFHLLISLDGDEKNNRYRFSSKNKQNAFQSIINNIDAIKAKNQNFFLSNINFNAVLHDLNSVKDIYNFFYNRFNKIPLISELSLRDVKDEKKHIIKRLHKNINDSEIEFQNDRSNIIDEVHYESSQFIELKNFIKHFSINRYSKDVNSLFINKDKYLPSCTCLPFSKKIFLTNRNKLLPCERINYKYFLGEINKNVTIDVSEITKKYNYYYNNLKKYCSNCYVFRFCGTCMFHMNNFNKLGTNDFLCERFHGKDKFEKKLYEIVSFLEKHPEDYHKILEKK